MFNQYARTCAIIYKGDTFVRKKLFINGAVVILLLIGILSFVACDKNGGGGDGTTVYLPDGTSAEDWQAVGLGDSFGAKVRGECADSRVNENGIYVKWNDSNKSSFDSIVKWLKSQGYDTFEGQPANSTNMIFIYSYSAEKELEDGRRMLVDVLYCFSDFSMSGVELKSGEITFMVHDSAATA